MKFKLPYYPFQHLLILEDTNSVEYPPTQHTKPIYPPEFQFHKRPNRLNPKCVRRPLPQSPKKVLKIKKKYFDIFFVPII